MFHLFTGLLMGLGFLYLFLRCIAPLRLGWPIKGVIATCVLAASFKLQLFRYIFGISVAQEIPQWAIILAGGLFGFVIVWMLLSLALDALLLARFALRRVRGMRADGPPRPGVRVGALVALAALLTCYGVYEAVRVPDMRRVDIAIPNLPAGLDGLRIVQLSDTHITRLFDAAWTRAVVRRVNKCAPDLVLVTGDIIDGSPQERAQDVAPLRELRARYGVYACLGNHEYYSGLDGWLATLRGLGIRVLANSHTALAINGDTLVLGGVTDPTGASRFEQAQGGGPDAARAFAGSPAGVRLLMAHQPSVVAQAAKQGVDLQLSGHTHGGQLWPISHLVALFNRGLLAGLYQTGNTQLYISRGAGLWGGFPLRIGAPSEITEIVLRPTPRTASAPTTAP